MKSSLTLIVVASSLWLAACGGSPAPSLRCQPTNCSSSTLSYQTCGNADGSATQYFGGTSCSCPSGDTAQCQSCAVEIANYCNGGGGGGATACTYTVSGAATASGSCMLFAAYSASKSDVDVALTTTSGQPSFGGGMVGKTMLTAGTFTLADAPEAGATFLEGTTSLWSMCNNNDCSDGAGNKVPNQGTFTLTISDPGPASNGILWMTPHGSLTATLPADPNTTASGTCTLNATF